MHLTRFTDYSLRVLLYLACRPHETVSVEQISRAYGISRHHLVKIIQLLTELELVEGLRGRGGGIRLATAAREINIGRLVRRTEPHFNLVECFDPQTNTCPIAPACGLQKAFFQARQAFLSVLDGYTLEHFLKQRSDLAVLLKESFDPVPTDS
jgi:Rrf2 family nitric oxide-sensitive transcriptional repressor